MPTITFHIQVGKNHETQKFSLVFFHVLDTDPAITGLFKQTGQWEDIQSLLGRAGSLGYLAHGDCQNMEECFLQQKSTLSALRPLLATPLLVLFAKLNSLLHTCCRNVGILFLITFKYHFSYIFFAHIVLKGADFYVV